MINKIYKPFFAMQTINLVAWAPEIVLNFTGQKSLSCFVGLQVNLTFFMCLAFILWSVGFTFYSFFNKKMFSELSLTTIRETCIMILVSLAVVFLMGKYIFSLESCRYEPLSDHQIQEIFGYEPLGDHQFQQIFGSPI